MERKTFLKTIGLTLAYAPIVKCSSWKKESSFFTIEKIKGHYFLIDPNGNKFFSIGINHVDSAALRFNDNISIWNEKYKNSIEIWLKGVNKNLRSWGFNTLGWNQEVVTKSLNVHRHSRSFTPEEYNWLDMPYCHMLPFANFHQWEAETRNPDFFDSGFEDWCDYVARDEAARLANNKNLIGYFYIDCPTWVHTREWSTWKGSIIDPEQLECEAGKKELLKMATKYYKTTHDALRRYDKNHLIFGDRYDAKQPMSEIVIEAALPYVNALSFQHFVPPETIVENLNYWHQKTKYPTLVADACRLEKNGEHKLQHNTDMYSKTYELLRKTSSCIGYHLCGAYIYNRTRKYALLNEKEQPIGDDVLDGFQNVNFKMQKWVEKY